jgi:DNA-binding protein H-NS
MFTRRPPPLPGIPKTSEEYVKEYEANKETSFHDLPLHELKAFHETVGEVLAQRTAQAREDFRQDFLAKLDLFGMSLDDLRPEPVKKERKKREAKPKYRNPNSGEEWSGRGKPPLWMQLFLEEGRQHDEFLITRDGTNDHVAG